MMTGPVTIVGIRSGIYPTDDPLTLCNACDARTMDPDDPRGYCVICGGEEITLPLDRYYAALVDDGMAWTRESRPYREPVLLALICDACPEVL